MAVPRWVCLGREEKYRSPIFTIYRELSQNQQDARQHSFDILQAPDWVNVVAVTEGGNIVLIHQYRHGAGEITCEIPGGTVDQGESPLEAARRELAEETGYRAQHWEELGVVEPNPAFQTNRAFTFLALGARRELEQHLDANEQIEVFEYPLGEVLKLVRDGTIKHSLVVCALMHLVLHGDLALPARL
jgi:ADP-ribose pyrophosphatase